MVLDAETLKIAESGVTLLERLYTVDDLLNLPDDEFRYELHAGALVQLGLSSRKISKLGAWLSFRISEHVEINQLGGEVTGANGTYALGIHDSSIPNAAYVSAEKAATLPKGTVYYPFAPDLAVEIGSPSTNKREMNLMAALYLNAGARLVWVVDPEKLLVTVYRAGGERFEVSSIGTLDSYDVLPGFKLSLTAMFDVIAGN